jgi:DNA-3-methyladenine glycosylase
VPPADALPPGFFAREVDEVARHLLGIRILSTVGGARVQGVVVETEAYRGPDDPASHAATRTGVTDRNRAMFGPPGRAYVYRSYGIHWCLNVVTGGEGRPQAVLLRGAEILDGRGTARSRRGGRAPLAAGPGRLCQSFAVDSALYGHDLTRAPLTLRPGWAVEEGAVGVSGRIGVREAADWPLRFYVRGSPGVSRAR